MTQVSPSGPATVAPASCRHCPGLLWVPGCATHGTHQCGTRVHYSPEEGPMRYFPLHLTGHPTTWYIPQRGIHRVEVVFEAIA